MTLNPLAVLREAIRAVPAVKYALGVAGLLSVVAIPTAFGLNAPTAALGAIVTPGAHGGAIDLREADGHRSALLCIAGFDVHVGVAGAGACDGKSPLFVRVLWLAGRHRPCHP